MKTDVKETVYIDCTVVLFTDCFLLLTNDLSASMYNAGLKLISFFGVQTTNYEGFNYFKHFDFAEFDLEKKDDCFVEIEERGNTVSTKRLQFEDEKTSEEWFENASGALERRRDILKELEMRRTGAYKPVN